MYMTHKSQPQPSQHLLIFDFIVLAIVNPCTHSKHCVGHNYCLPSANSEHFNLCGYFPTPSNFYNFVLLATSSTVITVYPKLSDLMGTFNLFPVVPSYTLVATNPWLTWLYTIKSLAAGWLHSHTPSGQFWPFWYTTHTQASFSCQANAYPTQDCVELCTCRLPKGLWHDWWDKLRQYSYKWHPYICDKLAVYVLRYNWRMCPYKSPSEKK